MGHSLYSWPSGIEYFSLTDWFWAPCKRGWYVWCVCNWHTLCICLKGDYIVQKDDIVDFVWRNCCAVFWKVSFVWPLVCWFHVFLWKEIVCFCPVSDLLIRIVTSCFVSRFLFGCEARSEAIENSCWSTWFFLFWIPRTLLNSVHWHEIRLGVFSGIVTSCAFIHRLGPISAAGITSVVHLASPEPHVFLICVELRGFTVNLFDSEVTLAGGSGIVCSFQCNTSVEFCH